MQLVDLQQGRAALLYLSDKGLMPARECVHDAVQVDLLLDNSGVIKVHRPHAGSLILKQATTADKAARLKHEAALYTYLQSGPMSKYVPRCFDYDEREWVLILEFPPEASNLLEYELAAGSFSARRAAQLGTALGTLHRLPAQDLSKQLPLAGLSARPHWVLSLDLPRLEETWEASAANLALLRIIQRYSEFGDLFSRLRSEWHYTALIHADLKWPNILACARPGAKRRVETKIIDWELARVGEPCWDVGSAFADYLAFWLLSIPVMGNEPPDRYLALARYPIEMMQPAMRALWKAYAGTMQLEGPERTHSLLRCTSYAAARLVQTAYEQGQRVGRLTGSMVCLLQLALNILKDTPGAAVGLLGLSLADAGLVQGVPGGYR